MEPIANDDDQGRPDAGDDKPSRDVGRSHAELCIGDVEDALREDHGGPLPPCEALTLPEIEDFIARNEWRPARTMPSIPHAYCLLRKVAPEDRALFARFARHIRQHGYSARFGAQEFIYFDVGGFQYWVMNHDVRRVVLINRALKNRSTGA